MKKLSILLLALTLPTLTFAKTELGFDAEMPYVISVGGNSSGDRGDALVGVHGNYYVNPQWSVGVQLDFGVETQVTGADHAFLITPGTAWNFLPEAVLNPYLRADVPMYITGGGSTGDGFDAGISGGVGVAWNLMELSGVEGLAIKYDIALNYFFDAELISFNIFRVALAYLW